MQESREERPLTEEKTNLPLQHKLLAQKEQPATQHYSPGIELIMAWTCPKKQSDNGTECSYLRFWHSNVWCGSYNGWAFFQNYPSLSHFEFLRIYETLVIQLTSSHDSNQIKREIIFQDAEAAKSMKDPNARKKPMSAYFYSQLENRDPICAWVRFRSLRVPYSPNWREERKQWFVKLPEEDKNATKRRWQRTFVELQATLWSHQQRSHLQRRSPQKKTTS